jgi:hypothetical protein
MPNWSRWYFNGIDLTTLTFHVVIGVMKCVLSLPPLQFSAYSMLAGRYAVPKVKSLDLYDVYTTQYYGFFK